MLKAFKRNKNRSLLCLFQVVLTFGFLQAQDQKKIPEIEKIYLHTDNSRYFIGEDLYYKAYVVRASNNLLFDNSNILYVELISPDSKIIARNKTNIEMGLGYGDFRLTDFLDVKPGVYQLRAYTNWNRNFGDDFVFQKKIEIIDVFETHLKTDKTQISENEAVVAAIVKPNNSRVDFFPEGGSLLENVSSIVGFKAVDSNGKPINVKGEIYDSDNELVTSFSSSHDGMGKFQLIPIEGNNYYAKLKILEGKELQVDLPKALKQGYLIGYRTVKGKNFVSIITNEKTLSQNPNAVLTVVCRAKGILYLEITQTLTETALSFELPKDKAPEGISQITLYDGNMNPQSERLVYIEKEHDLDVQLMTDKASYAPNEKTTVNITSKSKAGKAKTASFSLSVTDMNGVLDEKDYDTNICSYFLMESDIRGKVYNPGYYFDTANPKRLEHLEDLLLTQGWRDFVWKTMPKASDSFMYQEEKGITISGRVKQSFGQKPKVNSKMSLTLMNKNQINAFSAITDSVGRFKFENIMFSGIARMYLNNRNEKGKSRGKIVLDSIEKVPMFVSFKKEPISWSESTGTIADNVLKKYVAFGVKPENILREVEITSKKKKNAAILYGIPDYSYVIDKEEASRFTDIRDLIEDKVKSVRFSIVPKSFDLSMLNNSLTLNDPEAPIPDVPDLFLLNEQKSSDPFVIIDGYPIAGDDELSMISPKDVVKIEVVRGNLVSRIYGVPGVISVFTNGNRRTKPIKDIYQSIIKKIDGFYMGRVFYSPTQEQTELDNKLAVRNTLYWNSEIYPGATGNTSVSYYNTQVETKVKVALEGITATGIPVVKKTYYTIKKEKL